MRVLIAVAHGGVYSGGAHQALYQLRGLKHAGVEVMAVWGPDDEGDPNGLDRLKSLDIPLEIIPINRQLDIDTLKRFRKAMTSFRPDVVECFKSGAQYHALYGGIGLKRHALVFYRGISRRMDIWQGLKYRLRRVDRVIANSRALKRIMSDTGKIPADKIDCVYNEYDPACSDPEAVDATGLRRELDVPENVPLVTQLGNWSTWRGQDVTLEAAAALKAGGYGFHLLFAGRDTDRLQAKVEELDLGDAVTLSPYRRDPERVLKASDIAVNASTSHESMSGALVNAHALGVPAVASDLAGNGEVVEDGVTGYLVPPGDAEALAGRLSKMLDMDVERLSAMGSAARARAVKLFSSEARTRRRLEVYERAIEHRKRGHC
ncbi:MAG TPA: glycosyltransferase family 1 protein [Bacteroidetes bacterium]|nr:glycosyltransferase family 1 protein [Bacteroidota bacterium]